MLQRATFFFTLDQSSDEEPHSFQLEQKVRLFDYKKKIECVCYDEKSEEMEKNHSSKSNE